MRPERRIWLTVSAGLLAACGAVLVLCSYQRREQHPRNDRPVQTTNPRVLVAEADRLALLGNWTKARPLFAGAEQIYSQRGDERNAIYAGIGRMRCDIERTSYAAGAQNIRELLNKPPVQHDPGLRLECLTVKGVIDMNMDTRAAKQDWNQVLTLANSLDDKVWQARATGWLGLLAFVDGKVVQAGKMVTEAIIKTGLLHDVGGEIDFLTFFGYGLSEYHRPE
jgi:hypothetical protein